MKQILWIGFSIGLGLQSADAIAQAANSLKFFSDPMGTSCSLNYTKDGVVSTHVIVTGGAPTAAIQFAAVTPSCWSGAFWAGDVFPGPFIREGSTQDPNRGLTLSFDQCFQMPFHVGYINHYVSDISVTCCPYAPAPVNTDFGYMILTVDCTLPNPYDWRARPMQGVGLIVNATASCPCELPVPVASTTWGRVKSLYR